jgi:hypothetical protein
MGGLVGVATPFTAMYGLLLKFAVEGGWVVLPEI